MANVYAVKSGNWSDTTLWNTSALPATVDDVYANNFSVTIDTNVQVLSINTLSAVGISRGGRFFINNGISLSANVVSGGSTVLTFLSASPNTCTLFGSITGGNGLFAGGPHFGVLNSSSGTINIFSPRVESWASTSSYGNTSQNAVIGNTSSGTVNISAGNIFLRFNVGCLNNSTGSISITGNVTSGSEATVPFGFTNSGSGSISVLGNVTGGAGINIAGGTNTGSGTVNIRGDVTGGGSAGLTNTSTGIVSITGNVFGSQTSVNIVGISNAGTCIVYGNVTGGPQLAGGAGGNAYGINNSALTSNLTVYGNVSGAAFVTGSGFGILNNSSGTVNVIGNMHARVATSLQNASTGTVNVTGNVYGGSSGSANGIQNGSGGTGTIIINGDVYGGAAASSIGAVNNIGSTIIITGNAIAGTGSLAYGAANAGTGYLEVRGLVIGNAFGLGSAGINSAPGIFGSQTGTTIIRGLSCGLRGQWPTAGNIFIIPQSTSTATFETSAFQDVTLFTSLSDGIVPPVSSVRQGTVYNLGDYRGTCRIPSVSAVLQGVSVDNSVGIAALQPQTIWNYSTLSATDVNSLGGRLKEVATVQSVGQQLTALN